MVKIKMCGFTRAEDITQACKLGVDAIGLNFYPPSPRYITAAKAKALLKDFSPFTKSVALFVNEPAETVEDLLQRLQIDLLQFHGDENADYCESFSKPYIKVIKLSPKNTSASEMTKQLQHAMLEHPNAQGFLIDALVIGEVGGTGQSYNWKVLSQALCDHALQRVLSERELIIAGGLTPQNCASCADILKPYALDVSSGIESGRGIKDTAKMLAFVEALK